MATATAIRGRKGGSSSSRTPVEQPDDLQSIAKAKVLIALGEGEWAGGLTAQNIYLDGTPLQNPDGSNNFSGVTWEFRPGTQAQTYIQGLPGSNNEINVGTEVKSTSAWTRTFTNTQLSAVRLRLKWPALFNQKDNGDLVGYSINYVIERQTDGGTWQTIVDTSVTGKTTTGYERSHRIDLPQSGSTWTLRLRKVTADANSAKIGDAMMLQSFTEVIDAKLRYPNTVLLYIEFDSSQFNGSIPPVSVDTKMRIVRVPDNYDPINRTYSGIWQGGFKWAWTDNPAWIFYDIVVSERFGLGDRLTAANIDKWTLYQVAQYCDQPVPDGRGGNGTEPRYICNVYVQNRNDAYTVLRDFAAIFRGMTYWGGDQIFALADMPRDVDYNFTNANVVNGLFTYSSSNTKTRYSSALVSWSDPDNAYADAMEPVVEQALVNRYKVFNQLELTAIGCTRQSEANRKGRWGILTNNSDRVVTFSVGLDGDIPQPGYIIAVADENLSGRITGGRVSSASGRVIRLDRVPSAKPGDRMQVNLPTGVSQSRTIQAINGNVVTVSTAYSETPEAECVWVVESDELFAQQYRITSTAENDDGTFTITGVLHDPDKFARIDTGAQIDQRPISVIPPGNQSAPTNIQISSFSVVEQTISVQTMRATWDATPNAIAYEAQWRRNDGNWVNVPRSSTTSFEVPGIYAGRYLVRVRAINAAEISSGWGYSQEATLTGKVGNPPKPIGLAATAINWGISLNWGFPANTSDTLKTEIQYTPNEDKSNPILLSDVPYPQATYTQLGLRPGQIFWYRAQLVDKTGNESGYTDWVRGMSNDQANDYLGEIADDLLNAEDGRRLTEQIGGSVEAILQTALANNAGIQHQYAQLGAVRADVLIITTTIADTQQAFADLTTTVQATNSSVDSLTGKVQTNTAALEQKMTSVFNNDGSGSAIYSMKAGVNMGGNYYDAGMSIAVIAEQGKPVLTRIAFNANQLVLMSGSNGNYYSPWAVVNGDVFINSAFIQTASIDFAKISDTLQSTNFVSGQTGWNLPKSGKVEFNDVIVRGTVYATDGHFRGTVDATDGNFAGTVYAAKLVGDLADFSIARTLNARETGVPSGGVVTGTLFSVAQDPGFARKVSVSGSFIASITASGAGTGSYIRIMVLGAVVAGADAKTWSSEGFTFMVPAGTGNVPVTFAINNGVNAPGTVTISSASYNVFVSRNASVIS